ncbi:MULTISPECIES: FAD-dependent monooxygenase [unclassified Streptomyces]|uniref:FAD-dependent monooxygenase n=1 Tax=unclassified Streptomyces TaxID=2593676 RepID=UPI00202ED860|nr:MULTISPECIES: FAD-dependent monooxygenase [unclassified Streptomyces]MCM1968255.1 FAD-dependent monooxygenase [Streptomyces sp. G1]MCX5301294.1 FAD-dependent monooxygenase [Streptomyces sp. NBC_00193]
MASRAHAPTTDVLVVGAGPVGLSAAAELRRHGVSCRLVDRLPARLPYAKAVGIQPRTLEIWDRMGLARTVIEAAVPLRGQLIYVNGTEQARIELMLPPEVPYRFAALPQYETERILEEHLAALGTVIERGTELLSFTQDGGGDGDGSAGGVTSLLRTASGGEEELRTRYLIGCDGAHSTVRKGLGLSYEGGAFAEEYMLADVVSDWDLPEGYGLRSMHQGVDGATDDVLVCIPLPGRGRYRMSMLVPPELSARPAGGPAAGSAGGPGAGDGVLHGLEGGRVPELSHIQAVVDRLAPAPATVSGMRWSSVFRISHRIVDRYGDGRVFVAGDAAHIHPPTGAQGMNTGIQDACNLAWKLALALRGAGGPQLLASYDAERRPVGEEVVGRTVRHATQGIGKEPDDLRTVLLREAQLLVGYPDGPLAGSPFGPADAPQPGERAPDCSGLTLPLAAYPARLLDVLRGRAGHVVLLYGDDGAALAEAAGQARAVGPALAEVAEESGAEGGSADGATGPRTVVVLAREAALDASADLPAPVPGYRDAAGEFARMYGADGPTGFLVRPDGYLGARFPLSGTAAALSGYVALLSAP